MLACKPPKPAEPKAPPVLEMSILTVSASPVITALHG